MGIKFRCPNGHKLNVKAFLAGKRGICPECGVKFVIPFTSGGQVTAVDQALPVAETIDPATEFPTRAAGSEMAAEADPVPKSRPAAGIQESVRISPAPSPVAASPIAPALQPASARIPIDPLAEVPDALWYVRPASGGQFGPATVDVFRQWIDEGRIADDSFVWRDGWEQWQKAGTVFPELAHSMDVWIQPDPTRASVKLANPRRQLPIGRRKSKKSAMMLSVVLFLVVLLLLVILAMVFWYGSP